MEINNEEKIDGGNNNWRVVASLCGKMLMITKEWTLIHFLVSRLVCPGNDDDFGGLLSANLILLRNRLLDNLLRLLFTTKEKCSINAQ